MDTPVYDIVFSGTLVAGRDPQLIRAELARLFKTDAAGMERLFCGKPVIVKKGMDRQTADKYRAILEKAGAICEIRAHAPADTGAGSATRMTVAQAGVLLSAVDPVTPPVFDLGHMSLAEAGVDILDGAVPVVVPPIYDLAALSMAPAGSEMVAGDRRPELAPLYDVGAFTMAETGSDLDVRGPGAVAVLPDISRISLAPAGAMMIRPEEMNPQPETPGSTRRHLALESAGDSAH